MALGIAPALPSATNVPTVLSFHFGIPESYLRLARLGRFNQGWNSAWDLPCRKKFSTVEYLRCWQPKQQWKDDRVGMANNPTVLVVNDDPVQLRLTAAALGRDGFDVWSCADAEQALRGLEDGRKVDIVVTDLYMPGIDGWRLCRLLRSAAFARFNDTPILVVSSIFSGSDAEQLTAQLGADGFLAAP